MSNLNIVFTAVHFILVPTGIHNLLIMSYTTENVRCIGRCIKLAAAPKIEILAITFWFASEEN